MAVSPFKIIGPHLRTTGVLGGTVIMGALLTRSNSDGTLTAAADTAATVYAVALAPGTTGDTIPIAVIYPNVTLLGLIEKGTYNATLLRSAVGLDVTSTICKVQVDDAGNDVFLLQNRTTDVDGNVWDWVTCPAADAEFSVEA